MKRILFVVLIAVVAGQLARGEAEAGLIVVDYLTLANTGGVASISLGGTTVTGSNNVALGTIEARGIGVVGGGNNFSLDLGEWLTIDYGQLVTNVTANLWDVSPAGNVTYGFEAFNGVLSLGIFAVPAHVANLKVVDLTALAGGLAFSRVKFASTASAPVGLVLQQTSYDAAAVPEPATLLLLSGGLAVASARRLRRRA